MITTLFRDSLPQGLSFPIGQKTLADGVPALPSMNAALVFVWQSTWASQLFDAENGTQGRLAILQVRSTLPRMRINGAKVRTASPDCRAVVVEFAVSSTRRRSVLEAFIDHGATLIAERIAADSPPSLSLYFNIATGNFDLSAHQREVPVVSIAAARSPD
jgi:hypothetical protein